MLRILHALATLHFATVTHVILLGLSGWVCLCSEIHGPPEWCIITPYSKFETLTSAVTDIFIQGPPGIFRGPSKER